MFLKIREEEYQLYTKLGTVKMIEGRFKRPLSQIFSSLEEALTPELVDILLIAARLEKDKSNEVKSLIDEEYDYLDLQFAVQELITNMMFTGTPEQVEKKLAKYPVTEEQKNEIREMLGLPIIPIPKTPSTGSDS